jgi:hypothetical protein
MKKNGYSKSYKEIFQEHINNEESYEEIGVLYNYINQDYMDCDKFPARKISL